MPWRMRPIATAGDRTKAYDGSGFFFYLKSRPGVDRLATPLGIDEILAFKAFDKTISFRHWQNLISATPLSIFHIYIYVCIYMYMLCFEKSLSPSLRIA